MPKLINDESYIENIVLKKDHEWSSTGNTIALDLTFAINGLIRNMFTQNNWEKAYNKNDNIFRLAIKLDIKNNGRIIDTHKLVRKAILFWTRNPKINHRIWITVVKDESPHYPLEEEEAKDLLFDFQRKIEIESYKLNYGKNKIVVNVNVSWGKHQYIEKKEISKESNIEEIEISK
ncbi:MAG: hypothetical protein ACTHJ7_08885 [Candidatus Nitrosocosmicus sp.]